MKKNILITLLLGVILGGLATAAPRLGPSVTKSTDNNGDTRVPFSVTLSSVAWTQVLGENEDRRYSIVETTSTSISGFVCLSTFTTVGIECTATTNGQKLGLTKHYIEDHNEALLYGRNSEAASIYLSGEYQYDSKD